ncbi:uncharacterized protein [Porites lutea]|uniref:uncharacterized protein n=1 Tax=Porites lutea TaxID=51062 RepID=UPI003CC65FD1
MKSPEVLLFALATLSVMECYESADCFERMEDPGVAEHDSRYMDETEEDFENSRVFPAVESQKPEKTDYFEPRKEDPGVAKHNSQYMDFPRELDEEEDDDGNVENVEETFDLGASHSAKILV